MQNMIIHGLSYAESLTKTLGLVDKGSVPTFFDFVVKHTNKKTAKALKAVANPLVDGASFTCEDPDVDPSINNDNFSVIDVDIFQHLTELGKAIVGHDAYQTFVEEHQTDLYVVNIKR